MISYGWLFNFSICMLFLPSGRHLILTSCMTPCFLSSLLPGCWWILSTKSNTFCYLILTSNKFFPAPLLPTFIALTNQDNAEKIVFVLLHYFQLCFDYPNPNACVTFNRFNEYNQNNQNFITHKAVKHFWDWLCKTETTQTAHFNW